MTLKTQFSGPVATGIDTGNIPTTNKSFGRFTVWTPLTTLPVTAQPVAVLPFDAVLHEINIWKTGAFTGEAAFKFGTATGGSDNLGSISISGNSVYRAFVNSATAQTTLPFAHAGVSANPTPIYFSTGTISGTTSALASAAFVEVIYTRISLTERPDLVAAHKGNDTTYQGPVRSGGQDVGIPSRAVCGNLVTIQQATAASSPVSGQVVGMIPYGAYLKEINFYCRTAPAGEATVRFAINGETDNLGSVSVSAAGVYSVALTVRATVPLGINSGSGQPVRMSVLAASGSVAALQGMGELVMVRRGQSDGYPGVGQKETTFQGPIATGVNLGSWGNAKPEIGWGRFSKLTTTIPSTNGVVSGLLVGYLPIGAALVEINYIAGTAAGGEATVRAGTSPTVFTSDTLGAVSVSAAGIYSVISSTAVRAFDDSGVNRAKSGATAQAIYLNVAAASGSIATLSANAAVEIVYTRLDPSIYGV